MKKYFSLNKTKRIISEVLGNNKLDDNKLHNNKIYLLDVIRLLESKDNYSIEKMFEGGFLKSAISHSSKGFVPKDIFLLSNVKYALDQIVNCR